MYLFNIRSFITLMLRRSNTIYGQPSLQKKRIRLKTVHTFSCSFQSFQDQYADLAIESVKKNYKVGNLKPFASSKKIFQQLKEQVDNLQQVPTTYDCKQFKHSKQSNMLSKMQSLKQTFTKINKKHTIKSEQYIQSGVWDDHQILMEDYKDDMKAYHMKRKKTIQQLNNSLIKSFSQFVQDDGIALRKRKLLKFKKQRKVTKTFAKNQENQVKIMNFNSSLVDVQKDDYGIYSRSVNRAFYYHIQNKDNLKVEKPPKMTSKQIQMGKKFYKSYMGSYSQRKRILKNSDLILKQ